MMKYLVIDHNALSSDIVPETMKIIEMNDQERLNRIDMMPPGEVDVIIAVEDLKAILNQSGQTQSHWDDDPDYPVEDWRAEVANDDTRLGYLEWVQHQKE